MNYRKSVIAALMVGLSIVLLAGPASAWEFQMTGTFQWQYAVRGQMGSDGFFGKYDWAVSPGAGTGAAASATNPYPIAVTAGVAPYAAITPVIWNTYVGTYAPYNYYTGGWHVGELIGGGLAHPTSAVADFGGYGNAYGGQSASMAGGESIVSGSDAGWNVYNMSVDMELRINPALRVRANYYIGSWGNTYNGADYGGINSNYAPGVMVGSGALCQDSPGVQRSLSPGYWRTLWLTAQLPWGIVAVGKRPAIWGMGLVYDGSDNRMSDALALTAPYGPLQIQISFYPSRRGYASDDYYQAYNGGTTPVFYNERVDKNNTRLFDAVIANVVYRNGDLDCGVYYNPLFRHRGGESTIPPGTNADGTRNIQARDYGEQYGGAYVKYNNGRFFFNAEYGFDRITDRRPGYRSAVTAVSSLTGQPSSYQIPNPIYTNWDGLVVENGFMCGPAKISFLASWMSGDDYRYQTATPTAGLVNRVAVSLGHQNDQWSNTTIYRPYSYLMIYGYGLGSFFARDTGNGFVGDSTVYASRLDYAVAANLNIYGSFTWAEKFSQSGELWGCLIPNPNIAPNTAPLQGQVLYMRNPSAGTTMAVDAVIPTIPDGALGYEFDAGFDWKLLEGLTTRTTFAYWLPGNWWKYACIDKAQPNWALPNSGTWHNYFHTNPGRSIDPVWGMELNVEASF